MIYQTHRLQILQKRIIYQTHHLQILIQNTTNNNNISQLVTFTTCVIQSTYLVVLPYKLSFATTPAQLSDRSLSTSAVHLHGSAAGRLLKSGPTDDALPPHGPTDDALPPHGPTDDALLPHPHSFPTIKATVNTMQ